MFIPESVYQYRSNTASKATNHADHTAAATRQHELQIIQISNLMLVVFSLFLERGGERKKQVNKQQQEKERKSTRLYALPDALVGQDVDRLERYGEALQDVHQRAAVAALWHQSVSLLYTIRAYQVSSYHGTKSTDERYFIFSAL